MNKVVIIFEPSTRLLIRLDQKTSLIDRFLILYAFPELLIHVVVGVLSEDLFIVTIELFHPLIHLVLSTLIHYILHIHSISTSTSSDYH